MNHIPAIKSVLWVALLATLPALAQSPSPDAPSPLKLELPQAQSPNRFGLSYRMGFNAPVSFSKLGGFPALSVVRSKTPDGDSYNYDNGYVLADSSGNAMGYTRYWGYDNASQVPGNGTIVMQRSSSAATASSNDHYDAPMSGIELTYNRELIHKESWRGGLEGAFGYTYVHVHDAGTRSASVTRVDDTYSFPPGTEVPSAGYQGHKSEPPNAPVLVDSPSRSTTDVEQGASITGSRDFSADLFSFRFGPYVEIPLSKSIAFTLSGGFALVYVNSEFSFNETVTIPGVGSVEHHASGSGTGWLPGAYVAGNFSVALSDSWAFVAGAQFQDVGQYTQTLSGKQATLDLSKSIFVTVGLSYSF
jgi:hypothetical protein